MLLHELPWMPLPPGELPSLLGGVDAPWWLAGGWAIDAFLGRTTREHEDTDALILRRDQALFRVALASWDVFAADPPGTLRPWPLGEALPLHAHDVWCRPTPTSSWALQLMIDDTSASGEEWVYRRDPRLRRPVSSLAGPASDASRLVLAPEVQLLQKSKGRRSKDEADFALAAPALSFSARTWLRDALELVSPGHDWLAALD